MNDCDNSLYWNNQSVGRHGLGIFKQVSYTTATPAVRQVGKKSLWHAEFWEYNNIEQIIVQLQYALHTEMGT